MYNPDEPRKIRIYGGDNTGIESIPQAYEPPPKAKARYKNFKILTVTAFVLLFMVLTQSAIYVTIRLLLQLPVFMQVFPLLIEVVILVIAFILYKREQDVCHRLSYSNMIILIIAEFVIFVGMFLLYNFDIPWLMNFIVAFSIVFSLYILILFNSHLLYRIAICLFTVLTVVTTNVVNLHNLEFTPRYIYISADGYHNKVNDENNYYFEDDAENLSINENNIKELLTFLNNLAYFNTGVQSVDGTNNCYSLEDLNNTEIDNFNLADVVNFNERYDDDFFKDNSLYFSVIKLFDKSDTIEFTDFKYSTEFGRPYITYKGVTSNRFIITESQDQSVKAVCLIVLEVTKEEEKKLLENNPGLLTDSSVIKYR